MKIEYLQISNILSFPFVSDISAAEKITFDSGLNIIIGENGAGKSTALEVINFMFRRVLYKQYIVNQDTFSKRNSVPANQRKQILQPANHDTFDGFRLDPNWNSRESEQRIRLAIRLDEIDKTNIAILRANYAVLQHTGNLFSNHQVTDDGNDRDCYILEVKLSQESPKFSVSFVDGQEDFGYRYLSEYNYFKEVISLHNLIHTDESIASLYESFTLISSYRNYHAFQPSISLAKQHAAQQIQDIRSQDYAKSLNTSDQNEPTIFSLVRLRVAGEHFTLTSGPLSDEKCEDIANELPFVMAINEKLAIVNLKCKIRMVEKRTWNYSFEFFDLRRDKAISDINSLSAGQKAIVHLVFEAYGRDDLKGGVVIIDEPEIHLHYQFQHEYLQVINDLNQEQNCQYILVTHSEALINSNTISNVRRFSLSEAGHTKIHSPSLDTDQKNLIKILDNTRSTYAFFAKKVVLVEGDTDRYFIRSIIQRRYPRMDQEIAVLHMGGKNEYEKWRDLFSKFGLTVSCISDFDFIVDRHYPDDRGTRLRAEHQIDQFKSRNLDWEQKVDAEYGNGLYILKYGDIEKYMGISKGLPNTIEFCKNGLDAFLDDTTSPMSIEINWIVNEIAS